MLEIYLNGIIFLAVQHLSGILSPGPCAALVISKSLESRARGITAVFGAVAGSFSIKLFSILGLSFLFQQNPNLFSVFRFFAAGYLIYLGIIGLLKPLPILIESVNKSSLKSPFITGFLMSLANPMSSIRFIALFSTIMVPEMTLLVRLSYLPILALISLLFYMLLALFFSTAELQKKIAHYKSKLEFILHCSLLFWGIKIGFLEIA